MLAAQLAASGGVAGRPVQIITYDSETDPTKAVLLMKKAVTEDGVAAVVGGTTSPESQPMADYAMSAEIPFMSVAASTTLSVPARAWVFQMPQRNDVAAATAMQYLVALRVKTFAFLYRNDDFGQDGLVGFRTYARQRGITVVDTEPFAATDTDLSAQVARARIKNPEAMVVWSTPPTAAIAAKNIRHVGPDKARVREYLEHLQGFHGTGGVFTMSPQNHNGLSTKDMVLVVIKNGNWDIWK